ncbi:hypothetical protein [Agromyces sp. ZXT2-3]|uniref:hypothetical protein n=1 Tax=Agromyces sp. ZXT2-3 TaxID=3461152 RepID=UPI004054C6F4
MRSRRDGRAWTGPESMSVAGWLGDDLALTAGGDAALAERGSDLAALTEEWRVPADALPSRRADLGRR